MDACRAIILAVLMTGCASQPEPIDSSEYSALKVYEAGLEEGRKNALDELRALDVWSKPIYRCEDKVSWVDPQLGTPSWASRGENMRLLEVCRKNGNYNGGLVEKQRKAVQQAK